MLAKSNNNKIRWFRKQKSINVLPGSIELLWTYQKYNQQCLFSKGDGEISRGDKFLWDFGFMERYIFCAPTTRTQHAWNSYAEACYKVYAMWQRTWGLRGFVIPHSSIFATTSESPATHSRRTEREKSGKKQHVKPTFISRFDTPPPPPPCVREEQHTWMFFQQTFSEF